MSENNETGVNFLPKPPTVSIQSFPVNDKPDFFTPKAQSAPTEMKTTTAITVQENGNQYVIQLEKATCATPNICGFDHKFHEKDLARLEEIGKRMGLNVKIENDMIEFF